MKNKILKLFEKEISLIANFLETKFTLSVVLGVDQTFALFKNGIEVSGSRFNGAYLPDQSVQISGQSIVNLNPGDVLTLRNVSLNVANLISREGANPGSITLEKVG